MTVLITLTVAGTDAGPFNLFSDIDGFTSAFETGVSKASLLAGYSSSLVPDYTSIIRVLSTGDCTNYIDITLDEITTTTSSTSSSSSTTTSTTTPAPLVGCYSVTFDALSPECVGDPGHCTAEYTDCDGIDQTVSVPIGGGGTTLCVLLGPTSLEPAFTCGGGNVIINTLCV